MSSKEDESSFGKGALYHCYDCGGEWDQKGVDIYETKGVKKYVCKECRGRCIPTRELRKSKGVKSIQQKFGNGLLLVFTIILISLIVSFNIYNKRIIINDYKNYMIETKAIRKVLDSRLINYNRDIRIIEKSKRQKVPMGELTKARYRISIANYRIQNISSNFDNIKKPKTDDVIMLYEKEKEFIEKPGYETYIAYIGIFNQLKRTYENDYIEVITSTIKKKIKSKVEKK